MIKKGTALKRIAFLLVIILAIAFASFGLLGCIDTPPLQNYDYYDNCCDVQNVYNKNCCGYCTTGYWPIVENTRPPYSDIPFSQQVNRNFGQNNNPFIPPLYTYFDNDLYTYGGGSFAQSIPGFIPWWLNHTDHEIEFGCSEIYFSISFRHPHTGVSIWLRDVEIDGDTIVFNVNRLEFNSGGAAITSVRIHAQVSREHAQNVTNYRIVTRDVQSLPSILDVAIYRRYLYRLGSGGFTYSHFGSLVEDIRYSKQITNSVRTITIQHFPTSIAGIESLVQGLKTLSFVSGTPVATMGANRQIEITIASGYYYKFDNELFTIEDFNNDGFSSIVRYNHPHTRISANVRLFLKERCKANLTRLINHVTYCVPYVEIVGLNTNYIIIYRYKV